MPQDHDHCASLLRHWAERTMHLSMVATQRHARESGLSMGQLSTLHRLHHHGPCPVGDLGRQFDISTAAASQMLDRLVQAGLVERREDPQDRRIRLHELSGAGRELLAGLKEARLRWVSEIAVHLSDAERAVIEPALEILVSALPSTAPGEGKQS